MYIDDHENKIPLVRRHGKIAYSHSLQVLYHYHSGGWLPGHVAGVPPKSDQSHSKNISNRFSDLHGCRSPGLRNEAEHKLSHA